MLVKFRQRRFDGNCKSETFKVLGQQFQRINPHDSAGFTYQRTTAVARINLFEIGNTGRFFFVHRHDGVFNRRNRTVRHIVAVGKFDDTTSTMTVDWITVSVNY